MQLLPYFSSEEVESSKVDLWWWCRNWFKTGFKLTSRLYEEKDIPFLFKCINAYITEKEANWSLSAFKILWNAKGPKVSQCPKSFHSKYEHYHELSFGDCTSELSTCVSKRPPTLHHQTCILMIMNKTLRMAINIL